MKTIIFSKGRGWYISCSNYKDPKDKAYIDLYFPKDPEPPYKDNGKGFSVKAIDIQEGKFTSYRGKAGLTVFKYEEVEIQQRQAQNQPQKQDNRNMGGSRSNIGEDLGIDSDDLPFY